MLTVLVVLSFVFSVPISGQNAIAAKPVGAWPQPIKIHPVPEGCMDQFSQASYCPIWRQMGYCVSHSPLMRPYCAKTCGLCKKPATPEKQGNQVAVHPLNRIKPFLDIGPVKQVFPGTPQARPLTHHLLNDHVPSQTPVNTPVKPVAHKLRRLRRPTPAQAKFHLQQLMHKHRRLNKAQAVNALPASDGSKSEGSRRPQDKVRPMVRMGNLTEEDQSTVNLQENKPEDSVPQVADKGQGPMHMSPPPGDQVMEEDYSDTATFDDQKLDANGEPESGRPMAGSNPSGMKEEETINMDDSPEIHHSTEGTGDQKPSSDSDKESDDSKASWWKKMADKYEHLTEDLQKELEDERQQFRERLQDKQSQIFHLEELLQQQKTASKMINQDEMANSAAMKPDVTGRPRLNMAPWQAPFLSNEIPNIDALAFSRTKPGNAEKSIGSIVDPFGLDPKVSIGKQAMYDTRDSEGDPSEFMANWNEEMGTGKSKIQKKKKKAKKLSKKRTKSNQVEPKRKQ